MSFHDFGLLIWAVFIIIAALSSFLRSARRSAQPQEQQVRQMPEAPRPQVRIPPPVPAAKIAPPSPPPPRRVAVPKPPPLRVVPRTQTRLFGEGPPLVRGIIAYEVLGPPRALRDWTSVI